MMSLKKNWVGFVLCFLAALGTVIYAQGKQPVNQMVLTYDDGSMQTITLSKAHQQIVKIEFRGASSTAQISYVKGFEGVWQSNWGRLEFKVEGLRVLGNYPHDKGRIEATLSNDGRTMEGVWLESPSYKPPRDGGRVVFTLSADGKTISGTWWYGQNKGGGAWSGKKIQ